MPFTDIPPSYDTSTSREVWNIVAPTIPSGDLCSACLVSRKWHSIFIPFLWGDPASHFGIANDAVYVALTRFKRTLRKARLSVRSLTHTLHLPPALSEIYGGPNPTWLRDVLEYLPNLQSLIVAKLPFFDHPSLLALRTTSVGRNTTTTDDEQQKELPIFGLKLLLASSEPNITSLGLTVALPRFPRLVYLDLSYTIPARDAAVLASFSALQELQALKLRGCAIRDGEAEVLANSIGLRVRLLDLRDNLLTDMAVRSLLQACFLPPDQNPDAARLNTRHVEDWPVGMAPGPDFLSLDPLRSEDLDHELLKQLTNPLTGRLAFEDIPQGGLTHLYIANNQLSVEGLSSLLKSERLHILDGGSVSTVKTITRNKDLSSPTGFTDQVKFPGAEKLIPVLAQAASKNLTYLRVDHAIVTSNFEAPKEIERPNTSLELPGSAPLAAELASDPSTLVAEAPAPAHHPIEMPTSNDPIFELDATPAEPRFELVGDVIHFALSPPVGERPSEEEEASNDVFSPIRADGAFAPEPVVDQPGHVTATGIHGNGVRNANGVLESPGTFENISGESSTLSTDRSLMSAISPMEPFPILQMGNKSRPHPLIAVESVAAIPSRPSTSASQASKSAISKSILDVSNPGHSSPSMLSHRQQRIDFLMSKRPDQLVSNITRTIPGQSKQIVKYLRCNLSVLHPAALPNLRTLILTNVPPMVSKSSLILSSLKSFIAACADEDALSHLLAKTDYSLPPGRARHLAELKHARSFFALRTLILEMEQPALLNNKAQRSWEHSRQRISMSKSSTGDRDSENLWSAAADDFSFFGEEGEEQAECGIYQHDPEKYFPTAHLDEKYIVPTDADSRDNTFKPGSSPRETYHAINSIPVNSPIRRSTTLTSPRQLPLGRNRRSSSEAQRNGGRPIVDPPRSITGFPTSNTTNTTQVELPGSPLSQTTSNKTPLSPVSPLEETIDLIAELASWRKERKKAYENELLRYRLTRSHHRPGSAGANTNGTAMSGSTALEITDIDTPFVEGHWTGEIKVVRNPTPKGRTGMVDMYGNYFEKGYLYP